MKRISWVEELKTNIGTEAQTKSVECEDKYLDIHYAIARREAVGEITVEDIEPTRDERLAELHQNLSNTDYIDNKIVEALMSGGMDAAQAVADEYADQLAQRQAWRDEINALETENKIQVLKSQYLKNQISAVDVANEVKQGSLTLKQYEEITS